MVYRSEHDNKIRCSRVIVCIESLQLLQLRNPTWAAWFSNNDSMAEEKFSAWNDHLERFRNGWRQSPSEYETRFLDYLNRSDDNRYSDCYRKRQFLHVRKRMEHDKQSTYGNNMRAQEIHVSLFPVRCVRV